MKEKPKLSFVNWTMSPIYYTARIFGLAPYSLVVESSHVLWRVNKLSVFYNVCVLSAAFVTLVPIYQYQKKNFDSGAIDNISLYSDVFRTLGGFVFTVVSIALSLVNRYKTCRLMDDINDYDNDLNSLGITIDYKEMRRYNMMGFTLLYFAVFCFMAFDFSIFVVRGGHSVVYWSACFLFSFVNFSSIFQLVSFLLVVYRRFEILNKYISSLSQHLFSKALLKPNIWMTKRSNKVTDMNIQRVRARDIIFVKSKRSSIYTLCELHSRLCEWGKGVNELFGVQILLITGQAFVVLVIQLYFFYLMLSKNENYLLSFEKAWTAAVWGIWFFLKIFLISFICSKTKRVADESSILLHQINIDLYDKKTSTTFEMFSLQIFHQKLEFTACGFFPVDFSVLYMIVGAVTTYLVFLIQFEMASRSLVKPTT